MSHQHLCPICSSPLLCQIIQGKLAWYCLGCHQEVPYGILGDINNNHSWLSYKQKHEQEDQINQFVEPNLFYTYLKKEWQRLSREQQILSLILCEIDGFLCLRETYGDQVINPYLQAISQVISKTVQRPADLVTRYQIAQFAILLPNTKTEGALQVAKRIQARVRNLNFEKNLPELDHHITLSYGVTGTIPDYKKSVNLFLVKGEETLEKAKSFGQDQIIIDRVLMEKLTLKG